METLVIGIVQRSHGVKGFLRVKSLSGETAHFLGLKWVYLRKGDQDLRFEVEEAKVSGKDVFLKLKGIDSPESSLPYLSSEIVVPKDKASPLKQNQYYYGDLCRCLLMHQGEVMGKVVSVVESGASFLLEVQLTRGKTVLIPFVDAWIGEVNIDMGTIELRNPEMLE
ncbi:MAG: ribosome maturation factor RimM [Spirochaetes bacterium]|nr:ribosome maturation factor RimM [Spirochaetota bacterium]